MIMISINNKVLHYTYALCALGLKTPLKNRVNIMKNNTCVSCCRYSSQTSPQIFSGKKDIFKGLTVDTTKLNCAQNMFENILEESLSQWNNEGKRCIWFKVNINDASYVPILAKKGFHFHHARGDFVLMYKWLPKEIAPNLPPSPYTNVGVGAMVFNKDAKVLAIQEKAYDYPHWKLPGGYVEKGEDLIDAAAREVWEETGIKSQFESLVTFRHTHEASFGNSDIFVVCRMSALTEDIVMAQREIKDCKWMDVEEYVTHPHVHELNKLIIKKALEYTKNNIKLSFPKQTVTFSKYIRDMNFLVVDKFE